MTEKTADLSVYVGRKEDGTAETEQIGWKLRKEDGSEYLVIFPWVSFSGFRKTEYQGRPGVAVSINPVKKNGDKNAERK